MTSSEMHFGPSWMHKPAAAGSRRSAKASTAAAASPAATADPSHPTYSAITRDQHTSPQPSAPSADDALLDPTKPFKYSKEFMLAQWDEGNLRERPLPIEFERWGVVFREEGGEPVSSKALTETEKKLFALSYNPDRRPGLSSNNSGLEPTLSHRGERRNARPTAGGERSTTGSDRPLNSPARERFGGIEGGVLGGIGRGPGSGVAGEGKLGGLGARGERGTRERRTLKDGESDIQVAPLPPSSTQSWRPTRALSSNNPPSADQSPIEDSPAASKRWREPVTSAKERSLTSASANDDNDGGDSSGTGGGGFGGGSRAGGWRDRERHKTAERELGAAAGWVNVSKDDHSKSKLVNGRSVANNNSGNDAAPNGSSATGYSNAFAALDQDGDENELASGVANLAVDAQQLPIRSTADTQREELSNVKWTYKDPQGELQGPFMATEMQAWFSQGYFPESLLVKRESDLAFETVGTLVRLTSDQSAIFLQPAPIRPAAPPGLISRVSTPGYASPTTSWAQQQDNTNVPGATASALDQFLRQHEGGGKPGLAEDLVAGMAAGGRWESSPHQSPVIQHQLAQQAAAAQYGAAAPNAYPQYDPYGNSSPGPRHMAAYRQGPIAPSPYASPVIQHQAVSPWGQQQQPQQVAQSPARSFYGGGGLADNLGSPVAERAGVYGGYGPQGPALAPGAGWAGSNDWRAAPGPVPPQQFMNHPVPASVQQQQQYAQQQQQTPWQQPSLPEQQQQQQYQHQQQEIRQEQPVVTPQQQQQAPLQEPASAPAATGTTGAATVPDEASQTPVSRWAQSLAGVAPSPVPAPLAVQQQQEEASTALESAAQTASPVPAAAASSPISANATVPATPIKGQPNAAVQLAAVAPAASPASVKADGTPQPSTPAAAASAEDLVVATPAPVSAPAPAPAPTVAPWAKEDKKAPAGPSLREIQEAEARKAAAAKAARAASAAASGQPTPKESSTAESSPALPSSMSWGLAGSGVGKQQATPAAVAASTPATPVWGSAGAGAAPAAPQRTLKQIQEDETRQKQKAAQAKAAQAAAVGGSVPKAAYSGAASSTSNNNANSGAWATVGAGGKATTPVPKVAVPGAASPRPLAQAVPPKAAPVASIQTVASKLSRTGSSASLDEIPPSTEFLSWAKTALRSVTGMNIDEFLQMLLTFPLNPDSAVMEIISDSVYANSPTLDGRRFAQEFVTRRKTDAKGQKAGTVQPASSTSAGRGGSLADIVKAQPKPAPDAGFGGFKVVKKKGKK